jgi:hypothetical protein
MASRYRLVPLHRVLSLLFPCQKTKQGRGLTFYQRAVIDISAALVREHAFSDLLRVVCSVVFRPLGLFIHSPKA